LFQWDSFSEAFINDSQSKHSKTFANTAKGIEDLILWISKCASILETLVCLEHTGCYGKPLIKELEKAPLMGIFVVNPFQVKSYARQKLSRNKTDKADAKLIARFVEQEHNSLHPWSASSKSKEELRELSRYAESLTIDVARLKTRLEQVFNPIVQESIKERMDQLEQERDKIRAELQSLINDEEEFQQQQELLKSIPGLGAVTIPLIIAELPDLTNFKGARELAAWVGTTPQHYQSGTSGRKSTPISKIGNARLRKALYLPAMTAMRYNPLLKSFADKLREKGKKPKEIILAVERKMIHLIYGILTSKTLFNPNHLNIN